MKETKLLRQTRLELLEQISTMAQHANAEYLRDLADAYHHLAEVGSAIRYEEDTRGS